MVKKHIKKHKYNKHNYKNVHLHGNHVKISRAIKLKFPNSKIKIQIKTKCKAKACNRVKGHVNVHKHITTINGNPKLGGGLVTPYAPLKYFDGSNTQVPSSGINKIMVNTIFINGI